jgi:hypothetical protein
MAGENDCRWRTGTQDQARAMIGARLQIRRESARLGRAGCFPPSWWTTVLGLLGTSTPYNQQRLRQQSGMPKRTSPSSRGPGRRHTHGVNTWFESRRGRQTFFLVSEALHFLSAPPISPPGKARSHAPFLDCPSTSCLLHYSNAHVRQGCGSGCRRVQDRRTSSKADHSPEQLRADSCRHS